MVHTFKMYHTIWHLNTIIILAKKDDEKPNKEHNTIYVGYNQTPPNTNNVNKTCTLLQTTGGKDKPNIIFMHKS